MRNPSNNRTLRHDTKTGMAVQHASMEKMSMLPKGSMGSELHEIRDRWSGHGNLVQWTARDMYGHRIDKIVVQGALPGGWEINGRCEIVQGATQAYSKVIGI